MKHSGLDYLSLSSHAEKISTNEKKRFIWYALGTNSWILLVVEAGSFMVASSTISIDENDYIIGRGNSYKQIKYVMQKIEKTLKWQT